MSSMMSKALPQIDAKIQAQGGPPGMFSALFAGKLQPVSGQQAQAEAPQPAGTKNANYQSASGYRASYRSRRRHQQGLLGSGTDLES